jgi:hypothetical protein
VAILASLYVANRPLMSEWDVDSLIDSDIKAAILQREIMIFSMFGNGPESDYIVTDSGRATPAT